jgi:hypothetical protein
MNLLFILSLFFIQTLSFLKFWIFLLICKFGLHIVFVKKLRRPLEFMMIIFFIIIFLLISFVLVLIIKLHILLTSSHSIIIPFSVLVHIGIWLIVLLVLILIFVFHVVLFICVQTMSVFPYVLILILSYRLLWKIFLIAQNV